jgi:hypothetical protein
MNALQLPCACRNLLTSHCRDAREGRQTRELGRQTGAALSQRQRDHADVRLLRVPVGDVPLHRKARTSSSPQSTAVETPLLKLPGVSTQVSRRMSQIWQLADIGAAEQPAGRLRLCKPRSHRCVAAGAVSGNRPAASSVATSCCGTFGRAAAAASTTAALPRTSRGAAGACQRRTMLLLAVDPEWVSRHMDWHYPNGRVQNTIGLIQSERSTHVQDADSRPGCTLAAIIINAWPLSGSCQGPVHPAASGKHTCSRASAASAAAAMAARPSAFAARLSPSRCRKQHISKLLRFPLQEAAYQQAAQVQLHVGLLVGEGGVVNTRLQGQLNRHRRNRKLCTRRAV